MLAYVHETIKVVVAKVLSSVKATMNRGYLVEAETMLKSISLRITP